MRTERVAKVTRYGGVNEDAGESIGPISGGPILTLASPQILIKRLGTDSSIDPLSPPVTADRRPLSYAYGPDELPYRKKNNEGDFSIPMVNKRGLNEIHDTVISLFFFGYIYINKAFWKCR